MTWGRLDDKLHAHPKADAAGLEAMGLWVLALSYCCDQLTDGHVTAARVARLAGNAKRGAKLASLLVQTGFWHAITDRCPADHAGCNRYVIEGSDGFRFHDWEDWGPDRARTLEDRQKKVESGRQGGLSKASRGLAKGLAPASPVLAPSAVPLIRSVSDPDPRREEPPTGVQGGEGILTGSAEGKKPRAKKPPTVEHFMPEGWAPTPAHVAKARERNVDLDLELEKFRNWADNRKALSWNGRFATWLLNAKPRVGPAPPEPRKVPQQQPPRLPLPGLDCPTPRSMGASPVYTHNKPFEPITAEEQAEYEATAAEQDRRIAARRAAETGAT
jgi:hypothetical protein